MEDCALSWISLKQSLLAFLSESLGTKEEKVDSDDFVYNCVSFEQYKEAWEKCEQLMKETEDREFFYSEKVLEDIYLPTQPLDMSILSKIQSDLLLVQRVSFTNTGRHYFLPLYRKLEALFISMLGHDVPEVRFFSTVMLNVLYIFHSLIK